MREVGDDQARRQAAGATRGGAASPAWRPRVAAGLGLLAVALLAVAGGGWTWALVVFGIALAGNLAVLCRRRFAREAHGRHRAELAAQSSETRFRQLFESARIGIVVADLKSGEILEANPWVGAVLERSTGQLPGRKVWDIGLFADRAAFEQAKQELERSDTYRQEHLRLLDPGGSPIDFELVCGSHELEGRQVIQCYVRNLREQKRAEAERERFFALSRDLLCIATEQGSFRRLNLAWQELLGYSVRELTSSPFIEFVHPDDRERTMAEFAKVLSGGVVVGFENRYRCKSGGHRWLQWSSIFDPEERLIFAMARDVTESKKTQDDVQRAREAAEVANRELEAFSYSVSHDLRSPLRAIDGFGQALVEDCADRLDEVGMGYIRRVRAATARMSRLIDDLLDLSRISRGQLARARVDVSSLARDIVLRLHEKEPERYVAVRIDPELHAWADPRLLEIALENLLANAFKFTRKSQGARVELGADTVDGQTVFRVRDNGAGFDMAYADKLFGAFQRLHSAGEFEGTGIGLAIVARIVHRHGGRVWAEAKPNRGAAFFFTLSAAPSRMLDGDAAATAA
jgi:PAS domain S-box-containing protein